MRRRALVFSFLIAIGLTALPIRADTIVLKNGQRISAANVVEENGKVSYETPAGRLSLPRSIVERIERGGGIADSSGADLPITPPQVEPEPGFEDVARAAVHDGSIDREFIAKLEAAAHAGTTAAVTRVDLAHQAAAQFELRRGDLGEAIAHFRRALSYTPQPANLQLTLLLNLAYLHLRRSEYTAALDSLERADRVNPNSADVAKLAGWAYYGLNRLDRAVEQWQRALRLRPDAEVDRALEKARRDQQEESSYREGETSHFTVRYHGGAAPALARGVLRTLEAHFRALEAELNFTPPEPIGVILYTEQAFADITRVPGWVGAVNDGRIRVPVQGLSSVSAELSSVLKHELTHSFIQQKTRGRCPVWLHEGLAQWMEGLRSANAASGLVEARQRGAAPPLAVLEGTWMRMDAELASYAYAWSLAVVEFIVQTYGMGDIVRLLDQIAQSESVEAAARAALHMDYAELDKETVDYLRRAYLR